MPDGSPRTSRLPLVAVLLGAASLRLWTIGDGLPSVADDDEWRLVHQAVRTMTTGDWHPQAFEAGSLAIHLQVIVASLRFLHGAVQGEWSRFAHIWDGQFLLWARIVTALAGTVAVGLVYQIGRRWSARVALIAGALVAATPVLVAEAQIARADSLLLLLLASMTLLSIRAGESVRTARFAWAGAAAGAAAASSFWGLPALALPAAVALGRPARRLPSCLAAGGAALVMFLAAAPHTWLDLPAFLDSLAATLRDAAASSWRHNAVAAYDASAGGVALLPARWDRWHVSAWPALALGAVGVWSLARDVRSAERSTRAVPIVLLGLVCGWLAIRGGPAARAGVLLLPLLSLAVAVGAERIWAREAARGPARLRSVAALLVCLVGLVVLAGTGRSIAHNWTRGRVSTAERTAAWLSAQLQPGQAVVIESGGLRLPPAVGVSVVERLIDRPASAYRDAGVVYLVSRSATADVYLQHPAQHPTEAAAYQTLFGTLAVVERFAPAGGRASGEPIFTVLRVQ